MKEVTFKNLRCGIAVAGSLEFRGGRLIAAPSSRSNFPDDKSGTVYHHIDSIVIKVESSSETEDEDDQIQQILFEALLRANECLAALAANNQSYVYLDTPIKCVLDDVVYLLHEFRFEREELLGGLQIIGGSSPCADISFLDNAANDDPVYDYYREMGNDRAPVDYRVLQLWRFFEGWFEDQGLTLKKKIVSIGSYKVFKGWQSGEKVWEEKVVDEKLVDRFYKHARNFVAHGAKARKGNSALPRQSQSDLNMFIGLIVMREIADHLLRSSPVSPKDLQH